MSRFSLAALQIDRIYADRTIKQIKKSLQNVARGIDGLYEVSVERNQNQPDDDSKLGLSILSWVTHARQPLSIQGLRVGLAVEHQTNADLMTLDLDNVLPSSSLVDVCAGLVVIDPESQVVRLIHYTAQEFFNKERSRLFVGAGEDIGQVCLTSLS